ncbi:hypothetical protein ONZ43_g1279 [Nemania bipapillata]|uniref:Uncharacterized protein n=1 Tax=Nemania bipapillata TaxID=110536 RepID=A0ACC2J5E7_9PEZI|nr:hypothetical protein ONZ43_g1279 [Nemania bipapillata]
MPARAPRSRYNKKTAHLFSLMGGTGYTPEITHVHEVNTWPLIKALLAEADITREKLGLLDCDYTDWSKKHDQAAEESMKRACRDSVQWMGSWLGAEYDMSLVAVQLIAFCTIVDDICIPPLDLVNGNFSMYKRSARDVFAELEREGWGRDAAYLLLALIRQYILQYAEKIDSNVESMGLHSIFSRTSKMWDSAVYRTHTANSLAAAIIIARVSSSGPLSITWAMDSAICDAISMDLAKSALQVYQQDDHQPTAGSGNDANRKELVHQRNTAYHSIYLGLIDDLVLTGAPEPIVHFGRAGFLFVQMMHRYLERRAGGRFPVTPPMESELRRLFGDLPTDARLDGLFRLRWLLAGDSQSTQGSLPPDLLANYRKSQLEHKKGPCRPPTDSLHWVGASPEDNWIDAFHSVAKKAHTPEDLRGYLTSDETLVTIPLSQDQLSQLGSMEDMWALCMACQVHCCGSCGWRLFGKYIWRQFSAVKD